MISMSPMRRFQAMILLLALLASTGSVLAQSAFNSTPDCCSDGMCPMHRSQHSQSTSYSKSNCGEALGSMNCCAASCSGRSEVPKAIYSPVLEAVVQDAQALPMPQEGRGVATIVVAVRSSGFAPSPEQPPRS